MTTHRVAITVFCDADGVDEYDAGNHAEMAIRKALCGAQAKAMPYQLDPVILYPGRDEQRILEPVTVHQVMEVGMAAGNGYLWTTTTSKAYPRTTREG